MNLIKNDEKKREKNKYFNKFSVSQTDLLFVIVSVHDTLTNLNWNYILKKN